MLRILCQLFFTKNDNMIYLNYNWVWNSITLVRLPGTVPLSANVVKHFNAVTSGATQLSQSVAVLYESLSSVFLISAD